MLYSILMTKPLRELVGLISKVISKPKSVVEVGSRQAKSQSDIADMRDFFKDSDYVGVDMQKGPGVDLVHRGEKLPFKNNETDLVLCLETFEHCDKPWEVAKEIERISKKNGWIIVSSLQNFPIHMHPSDYFRFTPMGMKSLFGQLKSSMVITISPPFNNEVKINPEHVVLIGSKSNKEKELKKIKKYLRKNLNTISVHKPYRHRLKDMINYFRRGLNEMNFRQEIEFF